MATKWPEAVPTTIQMTTILKVLSTACCGNVFAMNEGHYRARQDDKRDFFCPACGSRQVFRRSDAELEADRQYQERRKVEDQLTRERAAHDQTKCERSTLTRKLHATRGVVTRTKNRIRNGICPCCNEYFANLHAHMAQAHRDYEQVQEVSD